MPPAWRRTTWIAPYRRGSSCEAGNVPCRQPLTNPYRYITIRERSTARDQACSFCRLEPKGSADFPASRSEIGQSLFEAQLGEHPRNAKPLKGLGGVLEIRDNFDGDVYRAVYTTRFEGVLYVLHAFQKKSTGGIATPQRHIDLIRQRLRDAEAIHKAAKGDP